uniref:Uncharacterized protein n=1 Tax=viral metagenome TaxID=1070528 RepID=A0A6H1ZNB8_9ZZZZ
MIYQVKGIIDGQPTFEKPINEILAGLEMGGGLKILSPLEYITDRQRRWYKGVCLPFLAKHDENQETPEWWDTEVKKKCGGLAYLKKEIFFLEDNAGNKYGIGRLTTKNVGKRNMTAFINEIIAKSIQFGWGLTAPDEDLRS